MSLVKLLELCLEFHRLTANVSGDGSCYNKIIQIE